MLFHNLHFCFIHKRLHFSELKSVFSRPDIIWTLRKIESCVKFSCTKKPLNVKTMKSFSRVTNNKRVSKDFLTVFFNKFLELHDVTKQIHCR